MLLHQRQISLHYVFVREVLGNGKRFSIIGKSQHEFILWKIRQNTAVRNIDGMAILSGGGSPNEENLLCLTVREKNVLAWGILKIKASLIKVVDQTLTRPNLVSEISICKCSLAIGRKFGSAVMFDQTLTEQNFA